MRVKKILNRLQIFGRGFLISIILILFTLVSLSLTPGGPFSPVAHAMEMEESAQVPFLGQATNASACGHMMVWDVGMGMCMPLPMAGMPMTMFMAHGNIFGVEDFESGPRGRSAISAPDMFMLDAGTTVGDRQYLNLDYMGTVEKWVYPDQGYPMLGQIGENQTSGVPFLDAQHPHNSPVMGITLSDTIRLDEATKNYLKLFFAPRGESGDGPIAFMHRPTGMANPDAPLGHHVGQDVGHISSTVIGESLKLGNTRFEVSGFNGTEPEPESTNVNLASPNSLAVRLIEEFNPLMTGMISAAYVKNPEPDDTDIPFEMRFSASLYTERAICKDWILNTSSIFGMITKYDHAESLLSFGEEFLLRNDQQRFFGRAELLQRSPAELEIPNVSNTSVSSHASNDPVGQWIGALTLGYTRVLLRTAGTELGVGTSGTVDFFPSDYEAAYGSKNPLTAKVFLQFGGMGMWDKSPAAE
jgi:hypothetical protein